MIFNGIDKKGNLFLLCFLLSFFFISLVSAQPPFQQTTNFVDGYEIKVPAFSTLQQNQNFTFSFHIYNISDGIPIDDSSTDCDFHLYDNLGEHLITQNNIPNTDSHGLVNEWEIEVFGTNFSRIGAYSYLIDCNSTTLGGFESISFEVTPTGLTNLLGFYFIIIGISLIFLILGFWIKDPYIVIFGTFGLYFVGLYILINGVDGIRNLAYTRGIALIILGIAGYISIKTALEIVRENY